MSDAISSIQLWIIPDDVTCELDCTASASSSSTNNITISWLDWNICTKSWSTELNCNLDPNDFAWWGNTYNYYWGSLWTWKKVYGINTITPLNNKPIYLSNGNANGSTIYYKAPLKFAIDWLSAATSQVEFSALWARFGGNTDQALPFAGVPWVSIAWRLLVWRVWADNYIYMYASWNYSDDNKHYEIRASQELAIGVDSWAFIYFKNVDTTNYEQYRIWVNSKEPMATLDVKWSLRVDTRGSNVCSLPSCDVNNAGTIIYRDNDFYWCKYGSDWYWWYKFTTSSTKHVPRNWNVNCMWVLEWTPENPGVPMMQ